MRTVHHVKKDDLVQVMAGKEKGKTGKILRVNHKTGKVYVEKVNVMKRHKKPNGKEAGGIVEFEAPIAASNVLIYAESVGRGVRTGHKFDDKGKKQRVNHKHNVQLDK